MGLASPVDSMIQDLAFAGPENDNLLRFKNQIRNTNIAARGSVTGPAPAVPRFPNRSEEDGWKLILPLCARRVASISLPLQGRIPELCLLDPYGEIAPRNNHSPQQILSPQ